MEKITQYGLRWATGRVTPTVQAPEVLVLKYTGAEVTIVTREIDPSCCCPASAGEWECWSVPVGSKN